MLYLVYGYLVLFITRPFENWKFLAAFRLERVYGILLLAAFLLSRHRRSIRCSQTIAVFALLGAMGLSFAFSYRPAISWLALYKYATLVVFYLVVLGTIKNEAQLRGLVIVYVCTMAAYQLLSLREYFIFGRGDWNGGIWRMVGFDRTYGGPNSLAASIVYSMPFTFGLLRGETRWRMRMAVAAYTVLSLACIVLTGSRSGLLAFLLMCVFYIFSFSGRQRFYLIALFGLFFFLAWGLVPSEKQARFRTLTGQKMNEGESWSAANRIRGWGLLVGVRMFRDRPLLGVGGGCFASYSAEQLGEPRLSSHNLYGQVLGEHGALGALALAVFLAIILRNSLRVRTEVRRGNVPATAPSAWISWAVLTMVVLLLFEGWASHNLARYNWLWAAAIGVLAKDFVLQRRKGEETKKAEECGQPAQEPLPA